MNCNEEDVIGKNILEFVHPDERERVAQLHIQRFKYDMQIQPYETIILTKDGNEINVEINGSLLEQKGRKIVMVILRDITLRTIQQEQQEILISQLEETRKNLLKEKAELVSLNEKLTESEQNMKDALAVKERFLSIISHDLINPVSGSKSLINLLYNDYEEMKPEEIREILLALRDTLVNLDDMVNTLILWAKSQSSQIKPNPIDFNINDLIFSIVSLLSAQALNKQIKLIQDSNKDIIVYADVNITQTILRNLISNAIKFTFEGGQVNIGATEQNDKFVEVYVKDNGIGMSEEALNKIFKLESSFYTFGTNSERGYGLGLLLVKNFVELLGGKISVESKLNQGSTFRFTLPKGNEK